MRSTPRSPAALVPLGFLAAIAVGTVVMMLPAARAGGGHAPFVTALPDTVIPPGAILVVAGRTDLVQRFAGSA